ncbi:MAG TPA: FtsL-like putative cell division protein [Chitinophagales bacterium]|jgi:cell division protein FtsL|nr:FtsL-like putative cell division protein [Chitinophagales bacterium]
MAEEITNTAEIENEVQPVPQGKLQRIIEGSLQLFGVEDFISYAQVMHNFFFVAAIVFIGVLEIFNTHLAVRLNRSINKKQDIIKELRWEYMNVKTEMNQKSKQSELQKIVEPYGLKSLQEAPRKIEIKKDALE